MFDERTEREIDRLEDMTIAEIIETYADSDPVAEALADYLCPKFTGPWIDDDHELDGWQTLFNHQSQIWPLGHLMNRLSRADRWMLDRWVADTARRTLTAREYDRREQLAA